MLEGIRITRPYSDRSTQDLLDQLLWPKGWFWQDFTPSRLNRNVSAQHWIGTLTFWLNNEMTCEIWVDGIDPIKSILTYFFGIKPKWQYSNSILSSNTNVEIQYNSGSKINQSESALNIVPIFKPWLEQLTK